MSTSSNMTGDKRPLPVESLLPFPQQRTAESLSALRTALQEAQQESPDNSEHEDDVEDGSGKATKRPKRARACIACRNMKIRCLPVDGQEACLGCSKVNRECVMPGPPRKRQKTVHKVAELEKKINALTDALLQKNSAANPTPPSDSSPANDRALDTQSDLTRSETAHSDAVQSDRVSMSDRPNDNNTHGMRPLSEKVIGNNVPGRDLSGPTSQGVLPLMNKGELDWGCSQFSRRVVDESYIDIIDRNLLEMDLAIQMYEHYRTIMQPYFPIFALPADRTAQDERENRPMVFLAILAIASSAVKPEIQPDLIVELNRQLSERVMFIGEKSLEIVQAMLVYTCYYVRSRHAKDLAFNQYIHAAVVMCLDLGMGKRYPKKLDRGGVEEAEIRRTWMACYYFASNVSTLMRHPSLVRWSPYLEDCVHFFQTSSSALPSDAWLVSLAQLQHIAEEVSIVFSLDDHTSSISFAETKTQYHLKTFEKQLAQWRANAPKTIEPLLINHLASSINLYIHEIAIHHDHDIDDFRPDAPPHLRHQPTSPPVVTNLHIDALTTCIDACNSVLSSFLALPIELCRCIPNLYIVWNTYASVALIKLHGLIHAPDSSFGSIYTPDLKVDYYMHNLTEKLGEISAHGRWPPAEAFIYITKKLKSWHTHKKAPYLDESQAGQVPGLNNKGDFWENQGKDKRTPEERERDRLDDLAATNIVKTFPRGSGLPERYGEGKATSGIMSPPPKLDNKFYNEGYDSAAGARNGQASYNAPVSIGGPGVSTKTMPIPPGPWVPLSPGMREGGLNDFGASQTSEINAAYNASNYNINWDELNFSQDELNVFDNYMSDVGWMGYIL